MSTTGELLAWIRAATRAPSTHNTQPWLFEIDEDRVIVRPDSRRALQVADPQRREQWMSVGCAVENMVVAARHDGEALDVSELPKQAPDRGVVVHARRDRTAPDGLYHAIFDRQTNRRPYDGRPLERGLVELLTQVVLEPGVSMRLVTDPGQFEAFATLVEEGDREQLSSMRFRRELLEWMRFNEKEVASSLDGLSAAAAGERTAPRWLARAVFPVLASPGRRGHADADLVLGSSALLLVSTKSDTPSDWLAAGRALERLLLHLTLLGVQHAYANQAVQVLRLRLKLARVARLEGLRPQVLLRLGHAQPLPRAPRRPLEDVVFVRQPSGAPVPLLQGAVVSAR